MRSRQLLLNDYNPLYQNLELNNPNNICTLVIFWNIEWIQSMEKLYRCIGSWIKSKKLGSFWIAFPCGWHLFKIQWMRSGKSCWFWSIIKKYWVENQDKTLSHHITVKKIFCDAKCGFEVKMLSLKLINFQNNYLIQIRWFILYLN